MKQQYLIGICFLITSVCLPIGHATEVISSVGSQNKTSHIRTLAASCAACHGFEGNSVTILPSLAGLDSGYFTTQMLAFKNGDRAATVMHRHAKGLTIDEINVLADYFSKQKKITASSLKPQTLNTNHE